MISADVDPPEAYAATHPDFRALIVNTPLSAERAKFAAVAKRAKASYTFLGVFSLVAASVTLAREGERAALRELKAFRREADKWDLSVLGARPEGSIQVGESRDFEC